MNKRAPSAERLIKVTQLSSCDVLFPLSCFLGLKTWGRLKSNKASACSNQYGSGNALPIGQTIHHAPCFFVHILSIKFSLALGLHPKPPATNVSYEGKQPSLNFSSAKWDSYELLFSDITVLRSIYSHCSLHFNTIEHNVRARPGRYNL